MKILSRRHLATRRRSDSSESRASRILGGRVQPASGALPVMQFKADVKTKVFLVEDKTTDRSSYGLKVETWRKLSDQAWKIKRRPLLRLEFVNGPTLYVVDETTLRELIENELPKNR